MAVKSDVDSYGVIFECDDWNRSERRRCFELVFDDVAECTVTPSCCDSLIVLDDHPLLWRHNEEHAAVYFSTPPVNPLELMGRLYEEHEQLFGGWRRLSEYLHANSSTLAGGHGLLAQGPREVLSNR